ncbi:DUF2264 domain-containing protein [Georgenia halophila]|uniref:DUF2264 domain-containing protein n=1 Tax=Georgenia halophila TaxID=620889 RepID=A0ABP8KTN6_9MICO
MSTQRSTAVAGPGTGGATGRRADWLAFADHLLTSLEPYTSPGGARITPPGPEGGYGHDIDGLEGFARSFLLAGFRLAGERGDDPTNLAERYARGLAEGTDPSSPERWVRMSEHGQAKVEAASIALILDMTRPWIWDRLGPRQQEQVVDYLAECVGDDRYPVNNWVWFRLVVQTFLKSVGGPYSLDDMTADLATHDSFVREGGWLSDGRGRNYDHYVGWALHLYPTLWARMAGAADLAAPRAATDRARLEKFLTDAVHLVGADGGPLIQGRSLTYRFAAAAPFWVGALAEVDTVPLGKLRRAAGSIVGHFIEHGAPDDRGLLTLGWHHEWLRIAQSYSGPGSPYWASKGLLGVALPADHPVWAAEDEPLPVEAGDFTHVLRSPGWLVSGSGGVVRVVNHGTDHDLPGSDAGDSPLYARLGYSTATAPLLDDAAWRDPVDNAVVLLDSAGRRTHRCGMELLTVGMADGGASGDGGAPAAVGASRSRVRWVTHEPGRRAHGSGLRGHAEHAGTVTVVSVVRGAWEVRLLHLDGVAESVTGWEAGGWPLAAEVPPAETVDASRAGATVTDGNLRSTVVGLGGADTTRVSRHDDASPLSDRAAVPVVGGPARPGEWHAVAVGLEAGDAAAASPAVEISGGRASVRWPDGASTNVPLPEVP